MFQRLFSRKEQPEAPPARPQGQVPAGTRVYAIGDVHGRLDLLKALEQQVVADAAGSPVGRRVLIYLGDYIDRGYESRAVVNHLLEPPPPGFERICLKGNHEEFLLTFLKDSKSGPVWLVNGGRETILSYGVTPPVGVGFSEAVLEEIQGALQEAVPANHLEFMRSLPLSHREGDYLFVHAGVRPGVAAEAQTENDLLWIRDDFLRSKEQFGFVVVHGHTPTSEPEVRANRLGIDTGAFATGRLTCAVLEGEEFRFLTT